MEEPLNEVEKKQLMVDNNIEAAYLVNHCYLRDALKTVKHAVSKENNREILKHILCEVDNDEMRLITTDTHRLEFYPFPVESHISTKGDGRQREFLITPKALDDILKNDKGRREVLIHFFGDGTVSIGGGTTSEDGKATYDKGDVIEQPDGQFPNYRHITDKCKFPSLFQIPSPEKLANFCKGVVNMRFEGGWESPLKINFVITKEQITATKNGELDGDYGGCSHDVSVSLNIPREDAQDMPEPFLIALSAKLLSEVIAARPNSNRMSRPLTLEHNKSLNPVRISRTGQPGFCILMPMAPDEE